MDTVKPISVKLRMANPRRMAPGRRRKVDAWNMDTVKPISVETEDGKLTKDGARQKKKRR
jgi:hypothetical protein